MTTDEQIDPCAVGGEEAMTQPAVKRTAFEVACDRAAFSASRDETRKSMNTPFGAKIAGRLWVAATDGHRIFAVRCDDQRIPTGQGRPPLEQAIPPTPDKVGIINVSRELLAQLKVPQGWRINLELSSGACMASVFKEMPDDVPDVAVFKNVLHCSAISLPGLEGGGEPGGISSRYLGEALKALGSERVMAWRDRKDPLGPWMKTIWR